MRSTLLGVSLAISLFGSLPARAVTTDAQQLIELEQRWLTAGMERDIPALRDILADDFVDVSYRGTLRDKADHLNSTLAPSKSKQGLQELKVRIYGDTGIVNGLDVTVTQDGSTTYKVRFTDVFVKRAGRWQAVSAQETLEKAD
jgi:ketosteroid isomerase-like protein